LTFEQFRRFFGLEHFEVNKIDFAFFSPKHVVLKSEINNLECYRFAIGNYIVMNLFEMSLWYSLTWIKLEPGLTIFNHISAKEIGYDIEGAKMR